MLVASPVANNSSICKADGQQQSGLQNFESFKVAATKPSTNYTLQFSNVMQVEERTSGCDQYTEECAAECAEDRLQDRNNMRDGRKKSDSVSPESVQAFTALKVYDLKEMLSYQMQHWSVFAILV